MVCEANLFLFSDMSSIPKAPSSRGNGVPWAESAHPERLEALWLSWNSHRRTTGLCAAWGVPLRVIRSERPGLRRWIEQAVESVRLLHRRRPDILFVQCPSLALSLLALLVRRAFGFYLVVDAHNEGVRPFDRPGRVIGWLSRRILKGADMIIVTNPALAEDVLAAGGRPLVLTDSLPVSPAMPAMDDAADEAPDVAVIATFRPDEPIEAILSAAAQMPETRFAFSGDAAKFHQTGMRLPGNVRLTGFLPDPAYWALLAQAAVVCDLTLKPDCLVCGAYEALAVGTPMVLSDNPATRRVFGPAAILAGSEPGEIADALRKALARRETLAANARELRAAFQGNWQTQAAAAWDAIRAGAAAKPENVA
jgi:glycosyltransferase involved in cell wall biosynthesis